MQSIIIVAAMLHTQKVFSITWIKKTDLLDWRKSHGGLAEKEMRVKWAISGVYFHCFGFDATHW